ncbi:WD40 domain-containing protein [Anabaena azotica]|uniref:Novel STAND NTPase 1 domain-containing protein n=1 Tax=Anabaena azotica FACHB-119 TaxID=947527 RepID=A0ABR8D3H0_9NOST|nr:hypothetical protein [Anabaena azotica]MBD2501704.1 hypothetical protein [Anabaena azotica FACHB-119]
MNNHHDGEILTPENETALQTLVRAITFSQGEFSLILLRCNYTDLRRRITRRLHELCPIEIREITLQKSVTTLYTSLAEKLGEEQPPALMVFGLEEAEDIDTVLNAANRVREEFRNNFRFPVLLWVNDQVLQKLIRLATDLESWSTTVVFASSTYELVDLIEQITDEIFHGDIIPTVQVCWELTQANQDLQHWGVELNPTLRASLAFVEGWYEYLHDHIDAALENYQQSLEFWQANHHLKRQGILSYHLGLAWERQAQKQQVGWKTARDYFQAAITILEAGQFSNLVAKYINKLGEVLRHLQAWDELQILAQKSLQLQQNYGSALQVAQCYGFLAEVALNKLRWYEAQKFAQQALQNSESISHEPINERGLYRLILASSQYGLQQIGEAITNLELAKDESNHQYNPRLYIKILETLRRWYFDAGEYLKAFRLKLLQLQIEQQYKFRAFVGASYLNPQRQEINTAQLSGIKAETIADEIRASGRELDVDGLRNKISSNQHKLIVIHGQSGVGKSSILQAGLIPALQQESIQARDALPVLVRVYSDWVGVLGRRLSEVYETLRGDKLAVELNSTAVMIEQLHQNNQRNLLTVLIFDQFEEFFFVYQDKAQRRDFYKFLQICLDIPFVKVVLSLREDYLHYLLELERLFDLGAVNNNILDKSIRYYLGNFSIENTKKVIQSLTERTEFHLDDGLIERLVSDLAGELAEVRPIELQIVGAQLQTENITTLEQYRRAGTKEKLVERFLEDVIKDCGVDNERAARLVLYLLTDENGTRPLKTRAELVDNLAAEVDKLDLVLEIFVQSGLVLLLPELPADRYQLVHDYLVAVIRQQQGNEILEELKKTQAQLKQEQEARQILEEAKKEAEEKIKQGRRSLKVSSSLAIGLLIFAGLAYVYAVNQVNRANDANAKYNTANTSLQETKKQQEELIKNAKNLEDKKKDAEARLTEARKNTQNANSNLKAAQAKLDQEQQQAKKLKNDNAEAKKRVDAAQSNVIEARKKTEEAQRQQRDAENKAKQANETLKKANLALKQAQAAQQEAQKGTELERSGVNALRQFEYAELEALVSAMKSAKDLKTLVKDGRSLEKYPAISPMFALDSILSKIQELNQLKGHQGWVNSASFSPDGKTIATASSDNTARLWTAQGQLLRELKGHQGIVLSASFSPDGKTIATASSDKTARLWTADGQLLRELQGHQGSVYSVSFSPDGKTIATASSDKTARLWTADGQLLRELQGHQGWVRSVSFSPDGKTIATASDDKTARLWTAQGQLLRELQGHQGIVLSVSFSPDGKTITTASSDKTARLWTAQGQLLRELQGHQGWVNSVSFSPDGKTIATASDDNTARLWTTEGQLLRELQGHQGWVNSVSFSPDGKTIATASSDKTARLWTTDGKLLRELQGHQGSVYSVSFSPDGKTIATASSDNTARLWTAQGQLLRELQGHQGWVRSVSFSPDGKTIATASSDNTARLWTAQGQLLRELRGHQSWVYSVSFSPDGKIIATASSDKTARLWTSDGKLLRELKGHQGRVYSVSFSPDGKIIATASSDGTARLWTAQGQLLRELKGHQGIVLSMSFSPDGKIIATASSDKTARLWPVESLDQLLLRGCKWLRYYVKNPTASEEDRKLCVGITE